MSKKFPHYKQLNARDCGAVCLRMVAQFYGRFYTTEQLRSLANQQREGVTLLDISNAAESIGMHSVGAQISYSRLMDDIPLPGIAHYKGNHFVVVYEATSKGVTIADPDFDDLITIPVQDFLDKWVDGESYQDEGVILLMEPTAAFFSTEVPEKEERVFGEIRKSIFSNKRLLWYLGISLTVGALLAVTIPFLLQMTVDEGIEHQNTGLLKMILAIWMIVALCKIGMDFVKRFTQFHIGAKAHIQLVTSFMMKVLQLPLRYFETKMTEDIMQSMYDNQKVLRFLTRELVSVVFASLLLLLFSVILLAFDVKIFLVFFGVSILQGIVIWLYIKKRFSLNYERHEFSSAYFANLSDLIRGVKDIKLNNAEKSRRWIWEGFEAHRHRIDKNFAKSNELYLQIPYYLADFRNIIIIYLAALAVISSQMSAGVLIAIVFILLQLNNPLKMIIDFWLGWSETKMSLERMNEVYGLDAENKELKIEVLPERANLTGENISFRYEGGQSPWVIQNLDFTIPFGYTTAILGPSGSGKSTLLNLLLNIIEPDEGLLKLADLKLSEIKNSVWLSACGVVPQGGHIFTDTIGRNIALGAEVVDSERLMEAARISNLLPLIERLPDGFGTVVGDGGKGLSKGQQQTILIARAIYKNPDYLFLDEATNDLDAESEKVVLQNIMQAFKGKTVVIAASRMNLPIKLDHIIPIATPKTSNAPANIFKNIKGGNASEFTDSFDEIMTEN